MSQTREKQVERSVDSLQKIYAVVVALAITEAVKALVLNRPSATFATMAQVVERAPAFLSFLLVVVPFYHGMNRHLDFCYIEHDRAPKALLGDFVAFFLESCILFWIANSIGPGLRPFVALGVLLLVDSIWAWVSLRIDRESVSATVKAWSINNIVALTIGAVVGLLVRSEVDLWLLELVFIRTVIDYEISWKFYFPPKAEATPSPTAEASAA